MARFDIEEIKRSGDCIRYVRDCLRREVQEVGRNEFRCQAFWRGGDGFNVALTRDKWYDHGPECKGGKRGGDLIELARTIHGCGFGDAVADLAAFFGVDPQQFRPARRIFVYTDANGNPVHREVREVDRARPYQQAFRDGQWINSLKDIETVPYNLPRVVRADWLILAEGPKDADAITRLGLVGSSFPFGAGSWKDCWRKWFEDKFIVISRDNDQPGLHHALNCAHELWDVAKGIKIINPMPDRAKGDIADWVEAGGSREQLLAMIRNTEALRERPQKPQKPKPGRNGKDAELPELLVPSGQSDELTSFSECARQLGSLLTDRELIFNRGGSPVRLHRPGSQEPLVDVSGTELCNLMEYVAQVMTARKKTDRQTGETIVIRNRAVCRKWVGAQLVIHDHLLGQLPRIRIVTNCPVVTELEGRLITVKAYCRDAGILVVGGELAEPMELDDAVNLLKELLSDYRFATPSDHSRALASLITPALIQGDLLGARAPLDLAEADQSQSGKGYLAKIRAAIYNAEPGCVTERRGGPGSIEESFSKRLLDGGCFIELDNVRGVLDSPAIESALTEAYFLARVPFRPSADIEMRRVTIAMSSNRAELTRDLAERCSPICIMKQPEGYEYKSYPGGLDVATYIRSSAQGRYLRAVMTIIEKWHSCGKPETNEGRHSFRRWARVLDWIVQHICGEAPLCDGLKGTRARITNPYLTWLRDVAIAVDRCGKLDADLRTSELLSIMEEAQVEIPGVKDEDLSGDAWRTGLQATGRRLSRCFRDSENVIIDGMLISRVEDVDEQFRSVHSYRFSRNQPNETAEESADSAEVPFDFSKLNPNDIRQDVA